MSVVAAVGTLAALWGSAPSAGVPIVDETTTTTQSTTTTTPPPTTTVPPSSSSTSTPSTPPSTTSTSPGPSLPPGSLTTTTTTAPGGSTSTTAPDGAEVDADAYVAALGGDGSPPPGEVAPSAIPDWARQQMASVRRSRGRSTYRLLELLEPLAALGFTREEAALVGSGRFPVAGEASYVDDWWFPRFTPEFHLHEGTDIFAAFDTPIRAPLDGVVETSLGDAGGLQVHLRLPDGTYLFFAHLQRFADQPSGTAVEQGDVIGYVGDTGNARGGAPHLHFEYHPGGGAAVPPKPLLDQWLGEAEAQAPDLVAQYAAQGPRALVTIRRTRGAGQGPFSAPERSPLAEVIGASAMGPGTGMPLLTREATRALAQVDWQAVARRRAAARAGWVTQAWALWFA